MARFLGIDYGRKRVGVAISDADGRIAFPKHTIAMISNAALIKQLKKIIRKEGIQHVVVGVPYGLNGRSTPQTLEVQRFIDELKNQISIPVDTANELLTTSQAKHDGIDASNIDAASATLILQTFLDRHSKE